MRRLQLILGMALIVTSQAAWGQIVLQNEVAVEWATVRDGYSNPNPSAEDFVFVEWYTETVISRTYLKFPKVQTPAGYELASVKLYIRANWDLFEPVREAPGIPECDGIQGWEIDNFGSITGTDAPAANVGPAPVLEDHGDYGWYDVTQIVQASNHAVYIVLSPAWSFEDEADGKKWSMARPGYVNAGIGAFPENWPRIVFTFMESGTKQSVTSISQLKAAFSSK